MTVLHVFPVGPDKRPLIKGWQEAATNDPAQIQRWTDQGAEAWGIPTGARNNIFVLDLDVDKKTGKRVGELVLAQSPHKGLLRRINVRTPSGGAHLYFRHFEGARSSTSKIGPKIDTRGEGGYVIAPGSITAQGEYVGKVPLLDDFPLSLRLLLLRQPQPVRPARRVEACDGEVEELLSHIPPDSPYGDWVAVLMALHDRYGGSEAGLAIADQWSAEGDKYKPGEVASKWVSFRASGITWATIPALAKQNGADLSAIARRWV